MKKSLFSISLFLLLITSSCTNKVTKLINSGEARIEKVNSNSIHCANDIVFEVDELTDQNYSIFFLSRHAEKIKNISNPDLLPEGQERAQKLATILDGINIDIICASPFNRTEATAQPTATAKQLRITSYSPKKADQRAFFQEMLQADPGRHVLVVGHSNTIPDLLNFFTQDSVYKNIDESDYENFYIVAVKDGEATKVMSFKY